MPEMETIILGQEHFQESLSSLPILPRLDRLDRVLQLLEQRHSLSKRLSTDVNKKEVEYGDEEYTRVDELEDPRKSLSSVLEEVHHKGTLVERLAMLENRVVQLMDMVERNTAGSNSSTSDPVSSKLGHDLVWSTTEGEVDKLASPEKHFSKDVERGASNMASKGGNKGKRSKSYKKMFGWFGMGC